MVNIVIAVVVIAVVVIAHLASHSRTDWSLPPLANTALFVPSYRTALTSRS